MFIIVNDKEKKATLHFSLEDKKVLDNFFESDMNNSHITRQMARMVYDLRATFKVLEHYTSSTILNWLVWEDVQALTDAIDYSDLTFIWSREEKKKNEILF